MPVVFIFSGQGSHYYQMGRSLFERNGGFRRRMEDLDDVVRRETGDSVLAQLYPSEPKSAVFDDILVTHPAIFMLEYALADTLMDHGVRPDHVLGTSLGEVAAAVVSGVLEPHDALRLVVRQARLFQDHCPPGGMTAVMAPPALHDELVAAGADVDLAGVNFAEHFVLSGDLAGLEAAERMLTRRDVTFQRLAVNRPFHSSRIEGLRGRYLECCADLKIRPPAIGHVSSTTGATVRAFDADHLWQVVRGRMNLPSAVRFLEGFGAQEYIDVGPSGSMSNFVRRCRDARSGSTDTIILSPFDSSLRRFEERVARSNPRDSHKEAKTVSDGKLVYMFPGQGAQQKGMGEGLFDSFPDLTAIADRVLGYSIRQLCESDPRAELSRTEFTQPALYVVSALAYLKKTAAGDRPDYVIGHSVGEFAALFAAGAFDFETGLQLVKRRGELMSRVVDGGMAAILNADRETIARTLKEQGIDTIDFANFNAPAQTVVAGPRTDLQRLGTALEETGAIVVPLNVSAPFHSRYMQQARAEFGPLLRTIAFEPLAIPAISNVTALPHEAGGVASGLEQQVTASVQWKDSIEYLLDHGASTFEEIGPGTVLTNLVAKIRARPRPAPVLQLAPSPVPDNDWQSRHKPQSSGALAITADQLGSAAFRQEYGLRRAYVAGGMYKGIASVELVARMANAGYLAFFGTGGLANAVVEAAILDIRNRARGRTFGMNLVCNLAHGAKEVELVELFMRHDIDVIEAAAFMQITPALVLYRLKGLAETGGVVKARHRIIAKISSPEVARQFLEPAPARIVEKLIALGKITREEARLAERVPMADDLTVEADSAGHTDMGVASVLLPAIIRLAHQICGTAGYAAPVRVGAAGGIGSPEAAASAFMLGADFIVTGSINQCTPQAGTSDAVKTLLQDANVYDTDYAPAGDMFELGARVQVLKRGVFFPARANKLYDLWRRHESLDEIDEKTARQIQDSYFERSFAEVYEETKAYYGKASPQQIERAETDARHKMALIFRWYFIHSMRLAMTGREAQQVNYQVHCGPAMGAFNDWVRGTDLEPWRNRHVDHVADRLLEGTADYLTRRVASLLQPIAAPERQMAAIGVAEAGRQSVA